MTKQTMVMVGILIADILLLVLGVYGSSVVDISPRRLLSFASATVGIVTFLGFFIVAQGPGIQMERAMRIAITGAVIAMYLAMVGIAAFFAHTAGGQELDALTNSMIESFQTVVSVVVGFYFASSAVVEGVQRAKMGNLSD